MPKLQPIDTSLMSQAQLVFPNKHLSAIHSISTSYNEEYLLSSDEFQVFLWSLENTTQPFLAVNLLQNQKI